MSISGVGAASAAQHVQAPRAVVAAQAQAAPVDSDGDHDGTKAGAGRIDVKL